MLDPVTIRKFHRFSALVFLLAILFFLFFQINKRGPTAEINPFAVDPYDAVGSFAIQIALLVGLLTYARTLRLREDPAQSPKARLIARGAGLVLAAIAVTLAANAIAVMADQTPTSLWGGVLRAELAAMILLTLAAAFAFARFFLSIRTDDLPRNLTPADAIDDLWLLVRVPTRWAGKRLPPKLVASVEGFSADRLFAGIPWIHPRAHPWRFAAALSLFAGIALVAAQLQEGLPPSLETGLIVTGIFLGGEFAAAMVGFALLGGYLGLRPALQGKTR